MQSKWNLFNNLMYSFKHFRLLGLQQVLSKWLTVINLAPSMELQATTYTQTEATFR